ncbi:disease resistance protein RUN1-like [Alnus glutinosa]|uniref:disease resistance protein RUN1-like n=1 Tax=Alnus glutinosa TaxID=3517 RepID=UPI002D796CC6|nr:disease resistance protein RUN1-like [Alnus glutinosa]
MTRLKMFINRNACFSEKPNFLSNELRLLDWSNYPGESLPSNFCGKNLVVLTMPRSQLKELEGVQNFQNMTIMNLVGCEFLRKIPNVSRIPNLEELDLHGCKNLVEIHHSIGFHDKLVSLKLGRCYNLKSFPRSLKMRSLKFLCLLRCSKLKNFPEIECQMECLEYINFGGTGIKELPSSIENLVGVKTLDLSDCTKLKYLEIPCIGDLDGIIQPFFLNSKYLSFIDCSKVAKFLKTMEEYETIYARCCIHRGIGNFIGGRITPIAAFVEYKRF